jgi:SAM-dependent methyltransferase
LTDTRPIGLAPGAAEEATGQDAKKYSSTNPLVRTLIGRWLEAVTAAVGDDPGVHADLGVGEGLSLERVLPAGHRAVGLEYRFGKVAAARERIPGLLPVVCDGGMVPVRDRMFDTVTCLEVLEHLDPFEPAVAELARITRGRCIVSVPYEPWFRLGNLGRGKNVTRIGNDPEHVQQFRQSTLKRALGRHFDEVETRAVFPWIVAVARHTSSPRPGQN